MATLIALLSIPLVLLNLLSGIVGAVWLLYLGHWRFVLVGVAAAVVAPFFLGLLTLPGSLVFGLPGARLLEKGRRILALPLMLLSHAWVHAIVGAWCLAVFVFFMKKSTSADGYALLLWAYSTAIAPWSYLAQKEAEVGGGDGEGVTLFFAELAFVAMVLWWFTVGGPPIDAMIIFGLVMCVSVLLQTYWGYFIARHMALR